MGLETIKASGPVIVDNRRLLLIKDSKDDFYKLPGGKVEKGEDLEGACIREAKEEINAQIKILTQLSTMFLRVNPQTGKPADIELYHYRAYLVNKDGLKRGKGIEEIRWFNLDELKQYRLAPNVKYLLDRGEIR